MDEEELRILKLSRIGRETIIKYGTYDMQGAKNIYIQNHPFYVVPESIEEADPYDAVGDDFDLGQPGETMAPLPPPELSEAELMSQIMTSNFRTGLSQEEVDALLGTMNY